MIELNQVDCNRCSLRESCDRVVWGKGNHSASIMIIGEYPNQEEDLLGEPFVSREGMLLKKILKESNISEDIVYLTYMVKCKPINKPENIHINTCALHLWQEFKIVNPKVVIPLGILPNRVLLKKKKKNVIMKEIAGVKSCIDYSPADFYPWYNMNYILQRDKKMYQDTVSFFKTIGEKYV